MFVERAEAYTAGDTFSDTPSLDLNRWVKGH